MILHENLSSFCPHCGVPSFGCLPPFHALSQEQHLAQRIAAVQKQKLEAEIEGADAPLLNSKVSALFAVGPANTQSSAAGPKKAPAAEPQQSAETTARIRSLLASAPVLLFMKGTPEAPRCGFSAKTVAALRNAGCEFSTFDILSDDSIRQGLKVLLHSPLASVQHTCVADGFWPYSPLIKAAAAACRIRGARMCSQMT